MNTQKYYEHVRRYFSYEDAEFGTDNSGNCVLWDARTDRRCAVGCAIPVERYQPRFEGYSVEILQKELPEALGEVSTGFLRKTQTLHDKRAMSLYEPGQQPDYDREEALRRFICDLDTLARDYDLKVGSLEHD